MRDETGKWIRPAKLAELLLTLPAGSRVYPNGVGNLAIYDKADDYIGWVDIMSESNVFFEEGEEQ